MSQSHADLMMRTAETDSTFHQRANLWSGRCQIYGGPICFERRTGEGATIEHILPRSLGGTNDLTNLGIAHMRCNNEKGRHCAHPHRYATLLRRLLAERERRWCDALAEGERAP